MMTSTARALVPVPLAALCSRLFWTPPVVSAAISLVLPEQSKMLDQIERCISRDLDKDEVAGVPSPSRLVIRHPRPAVRRGPARGGRPAGAPPRTTFGGVRRRREREFHNAGRS